jgi:serine/threonine-protein kinase RsbW
MRMRIVFWLPRNATSVSVARQALDRIFALFGVRPDCRDELALAVSEACSNAVRHATGEHDYELCAEAEDNTVVIEVRDGGPGLPADLDTEAMAATDTTTGRGLALMRDTTDQVELRRRRTGGLSVRMSKRLTWERGALGQAGS